jgi:hypothetical protein
MGHSRVRLMAWWREGPKVYQTALPMARPMARRNPQGCSPISIAARPNEEVPEVRKECWASICYKA